MRTHTSLGLGALAIALTACGAAPHSRAAGAVSPMTVRSVAWNPTNAKVGEVRAVADAGNVVAVFARGEATVLATGAVVATDRSASDWTGAATIAGADGATTWIVGLDDRGHVRRLRGLNAFEDVSARYGLEARRVTSAAMLDAGRVAFLADGEIVVAEAGRVARYGPAPFAELAGGGGAGAGVAPGALVVFDARTSAKTYAVPGLTHAAIGRDGRLYATTARAVYAAPPGGELALVYDAERASIHGLAASGDRVWFVDGEELAMVDGARVAETTGAHLASDATLAPSPSGDTWVIAHGALQRFARVDTASPTVGAWTATIAPIFARVCASCHAADGISGTDLSNAAEWEAERAEIRDRVIAKESMPPQGHAISESERAAIRAWVDGSK